MTIRFDYQNMLSVNIGATGISAEELAALQARTGTIHRRLQQRRSSGQLPFYDLPFDAQSLGRVETLVDEIRGRYANLVVLGIGGSALGTKALFRALCPLEYNLLPASERGGRPRLFVLDNVDPVAVAAVLNVCRPAETLFCVISKSGSTVETAAQLSIAQQWLKRGVGEGWRDHLLAITDPENGGLRELVRTQGLKSLPIPPGVGGRFSVLTAVGLFPLALVGVDIRGLLAGARQMEARVCCENLRENPAYLNAALQYLAYGKGMPISVMMPYSEQLRDIADWYRQLWAESLGKKYSLGGKAVHVGPTPVKALGSTDQHSQVQLYMEGPFDKVVTFISVENFEGRGKIPSFPETPGLEYLAGRSLAELLDAEQRATALALSRNGRPNCNLRLDAVTAENLGGLIYLFEVQTLFAGALFDIDPLDQPGVEEGKELTYGLMGRPGFEQRKAEILRWEEAVTQRQR